MRYGLTGVPWSYEQPRDRPRVGDTLTTSASALVGIVREVVAHDTTPDLFRVRITVDAGTPDEFDKWTMVRIGHKGANRA